jgi:hypothetical protein
VRATYTDVFAKALGLPKAYLAKCA